MEWLRYIKLHHHHHHHHHQILYHVIYGISIFNFNTSTKIKMMKFNIRSFQNTKSFTMWSTGFPFSTLIPQQRSKWWNSISGRSRTQILVQVLKQVQLRITTLYTTRTARQCWCRHWGYCCVLAVAGCSARHGHDDGLCEQDDGLHCGQVLRGGSLKGQSLRVQTGVSKYNSRLFSDYFQDSITIFQDSITIFQDSITIFHDNVSPSASIITTHTVWRFWS